MERARAQLACHYCGRTAWLEGFTLSELDLVKHLTGAIVDQARKHWRRSPSEVEAIQKARREKVN